VRRGGVLGGKEERGRRDLNPFVDGNGAWELRTGLPRNKRTGPYNIFGWGSSTKKKKEIHFEKNTVEEKGGSQKRIGFPKTPLLNKGRVSIATLLGRGCVSFERGLQKESRGLEPRKTHRLLRLATAI